MILVNSNLEGNLFYVSEKKNAYQHSLAFKVNICRKQNIVNIHLAVQKSVDSLTKSPSCQKRNISL